MTVPQPLPHPPPPSLPIVPNPFPHPLHPPHPRPLPPMTLTNTIILSRLVTLTLPGVNIITSTPLPARFKLCKNQLRAWVPQALSTTTMRILSGDTKDCASTQRDTPPSPPSPRWTCATTWITCTWTCWNRTCWNRDRRDGTLRLCLHLSPPSHRWETNGRWILNQGNRRESRES